MVVYPYDDKLNADRILEEWDDVCKNLGTEGFLTFGTALGFVRDGGYIKGDWDIDVGIHREYFSQFYDAMIEQGFSSPNMKRDSGKLYIDALLWNIEIVSPGSHIKFIKYNIVLDVWLGLHLVSVAEFIESFDKVTYEGHEYNVPHPVEEYLKYRYGDNWRIPEKK